MGRTQAGVSGQIMGGSQGVVAQVMGGSQGGFGQAMGGSRIMSGSRGGFSGQVMCGCQSGDSLWVATCCGGFHTRTGEFISGEFSPYSRKKLVPHSKENSKVLSLSKTITVMVKIVHSVVVT